MIVDEAGLLGIIFAHDKDIFELGFWYITLVGLLIAADIKHSSRQTQTRSPEAAQLHRPQRQAAPSPRFKGNLIRLLDGDLQAHRRAPIHIKYRDPGISDK